MPPRIDPARREIAVGTRRLPFRLDLRNDQVSVTLGGTETAVRPLQWREKVILARFSDLGPELLRDEVIRLCTVSGLPSPLADEDAEVLWELAAWMSESPGSTPVPLDSRSLATVTLRLCREMGLKPADFDSRSAPEVEAMWEALGQTEAVGDDSPPESSSLASMSSSSSSSSSASTTRIVIVPDEVPPPDIRESLVKTANEAETIASTNAAIEPRSSAAPSMSPSPQIKHRELVVPDAGQPSPRPAGLKSDLRSAHTSPPAIASQSRSQSIGAMAMASATAPARTAAVDRTVPTPAEQSQSAVASWSRELQPPVVFAASSLAEARGFTATPFERHEHETAAAPLRIERLAESSLPLVMAEDRESETPHDFFEELADRLEQAAAEMGLGEE